MAQKRFDIRDLDFFQCKNVFTGSVGDFRYRIIPEDGILKCYIWYGKLCSQKSEDAASEEFPLDKAGYDQMLEWLEKQLASFEINYQE